MQSATAPVEPWAYRQGGDGAQATKLRCVRIALEMCEADPVGRGRFLWKWCLTRREWNRNFVLQYPAMERVLRERWVNE